MSHAYNYFDFPPTPVLNVRGDATASPSMSRGANGCVVCPSVVPTTCANLECPKGQACQQTAQGCNTCPTYYCAASSSTPSSGSSTPIGGIVGGVVGGAAVLALLGALYYFFIWRKSHPLSLEDDDIVMGGLDGSFNGGEDSESSYVISNMDTHLGDPAGSNGSGTGSTGENGEERHTEKRPPNRRLSTYESFTRPQARYAGSNNSSKKVQNRSINRYQQQQHQQQMMMSQQRSVYIDPNNSNRNSVATSISTTNASNILPIAYIPGVTVRPTKNNTRSIYSYENETESVFSDLNTIENASIIGGHRPHPIEVTNANNLGPKDATMTAIKAQPRLVNVGMIEEEEEDDYDDDDDDDDEEDDDHNHLGDEIVDASDSDDTDSDIENFPTAINEGAEAPKSITRNASTSTNVKVNANANTNIPANRYITTEETDDDQSMHTAKNRESKLSAQDSMATYDEEDSDSDVDSDIGEIVRAKLTTLSVNPREVDVSGPLSPHTPTTLGGASTILEYNDMDRPQPPQNRGGLPQSSSHGSFLLDVDIIGPSPRKQPSQSKLQNNESPFADPKNVQDNI